MDSRGLPPAEVVRFGLGFVEDPLPGHELFRGWLAIPYLRPPPTGGTPRSAVSIRFRCIQDHEHRGHGKYLFENGDTPRMYNTPSLLVPSAFVGITEGELDAVTAELCGIPTVGIPGTKNWKPAYREAFLGYREVFVFADGDEPGLGFATEVVGSLSNAKLIPMPSGLDVNSFVQQEGREALREKVGL
ncbi:toprim domain-containing protein [Nocardia sp. NPDC001965]